MEVAATAREIWDGLVREGGLKPEDWDLPLADRLRRLLGLNHTPIREQLESTTVSTTRFIRAFFEAAEPYVKMWDRLLAMFQSAGAQATTDRIRIEYQFERVSHAVSFNLDHFRRAREIVHLGIAQFDLRAIEPSTLWDIFEAARGDLDRGDVPREVASWVARFWDREPWPASLPQRPGGFEDASVQKLLDELWALVALILAEVREVSTDWETIRGLELSDAATPGGTPVGSLVGLENDMWMANMVETLHTLPSSLDDDWSRRVDAALDPVRNVDTHLSQLTSYVQEFLDLPLWRHRYELFSNWVCTVVLDSLRDQLPRVHSSPDGVIRFAFSGCHLATFDGFSPRLHLWTELKTPLVDPVGTGRKKSIQPDISLVFDPLSEIVDCPVVIECKQYLRPANKAFADALNDYARGRPKAAAVLVDHGRVSESTVLSLVNPEVVGRCSVVSELSPDNPESMLRLQRLIHKRLGLQSDSLAEPGEFHEVLSQLSGEVSFVLTWEPSQLDLDLHLRVEHPDWGNHHIAFNQMGVADQPPYVTLDRDDRAGPGCETIRVHHLKPRAEYEVWVERYSPVGTIGGAGARVDLVTSNQQFTAVSPDVADERWVVGRFTAPEI